MAAVNLVRLSKSNSKLRSEENLRIKRVQCPEHLFPCLNGESAEGKSLLALMEAQTVRQANSDGFVVLKSLVVCPDCTVQYGQDETLQGEHSVLHQHRLQCIDPLLFADSHLMNIGGLGRQAGNTKDKIKLGNVVLALDLVRICHKFLIRAEDGGFVDDRK